MKKIMTAIFAAVTLSAAAPAYAAAVKTGDYIHAGTYNNHALLWRCVGQDENGTLMLSNNVICCKAFDSAGDHGNKDQNSGGSNLWSGSDIRAWLNSKENTVDYGSTPPDREHVWQNAYPYADESGFLTAFTADEQALMKRVSLKTPLCSLDKELSKGTYKNIVFGENNEIAENEFDYEITEDTVFLLDNQQLNMVQNSFNDNFYLYGGTALYDNGMYGHTETDMKNLYLLRTPNTDGVWAPDRITTVDTRSGLVTQFNQAYMPFGIRPAFYLNENVDFGSGTGTMKDPYTLDGAKFDPASLPPAVDEKPRSIPSFTDCSDKDVDFLARAGIISGTDENTFSPDSTLTRAQAAKLISFGQSGGDDTVKFADLPNTHWAYPYVCYGVLCDWIDGFEDNTFRPDEDVTALQFVSMLLKSAGYSPLIQAKGGYPDGVTALAIENGLSEYTSDMPVTRIDAAHMLRIYLDIPVMQVASYDAMISDTAENLMTPTMKKGPTMMIFNNIYRINGEIIGADGNLLTIKNHTERSEDDLNNTVPFGWEYKDGDTIQMTAAYSDIEKAKSGKLYFTQSGGSDSYIVFYVE